VKDFVWNSPEWWIWFKSHRRRPSIRTLTRHLQTYSAFIVFHGCRPNDLSRYYSSGLQPPDLDTLNEAARRIFLSADVPPITEHALSTAIDKISRLSHVGKLYVVLDDRDLIHGSGHYMIYGSEHLCGIAALLSRENGFDYRQVLKRFGAPTLIRFRLPQSSISQQQIDELAQCLRETIWEERRRNPSPPLIDFYSM